ncbi:hypothetical protein BDV98DRAFT_642222 [Pterulicium gracile]|uniref:Uncharacterized protein n=1 Tax=Pterulicium gracile TaxID=1884261 RepID=A0A5C3QNK6_9AGAR|nr:hypothetical protein BDV98DRAFT_642222 [Pterula gracilis]
MKEMVLKSRRLGQGSKGRRSLHNRPRMTPTALDEKVRSLQASGSTSVPEGAQDYMDFCTIHKLSLTPTPTTLSRYIAYTSYYPSSGPRYLAEAQQHLLTRFPGFKCALATSEVQKVIAGLKKLFVAIVVCGFYGWHGLGELVSPDDRALFDWDKLIKRHTLVFLDGSIGYHLPDHHNTLSDPSSKGTDIQIPSQSIACPVGVMKGHYLPRRDKLHGAHPALFVRACSDMSTRSWFEAKLLSFLPANRDLQVQGRCYSLRAGGAV